MMGICWVKASEDNEPDKILIHFIRAKYEHDTDTIILYYLSICCIQRIGRNWVSNDLFGGNLRGYRKGILIICLSEKLSLI